MRLVTQGKHIGEGDVSTIEPTEHLRARLFSFWDTLLPPTGPEPQTTSTPNDRQILLVSHGGAIRGLVAALLESRSKDYTLDLQGDAESIAEGTSKRIGNCSITQFVVDWNSEQGASSPSSGPRREGEVAGRAALGHPKTDALSIFPLTFPAYVSMENRAMGGTIGAVRGPGPLC